jgi:DnaK suppressor protein
MQDAPARINGFQKTLEQKEADLFELLRLRDGLTIEKSADPMDEIQYASERDLAIRNADRDFTLLRDVRSALQRIRDGDFGVCLDCESQIGENRLVAVPWAQRCIRCQNAADSGREQLTNAA